MTEKPQVEMKIIYRLLREVQAVARHASMARQKGTPILADTYNRCLSLLADQDGTTISILFQSLTRESASVEDVAAAAALLASYMEAIDPTLGAKKILHVPPIEHMGHPGHAGHPVHTPHPGDLFDLDDLEPPLPPIPPMRPFGKKE